MDPIAQAWVELKFENLYLKARGESFQELFSTLLEKRYPGDFVRVRPWGNVGDKKNDGHLPSARTIFQCYAPNELTAADAIKKINADFMGALAHWPDDFDRWIFVHNSKAGLGPDVLKALLDLQTNHPGKLVQSWGYEELLREVLFLEEGQLTSFLGAAPTRQAIVDLGMEDLVPVLDQIARHSVKPEIDVRPVPPDKLTRNMLSMSVETLLLAGMVRTPLVRQYFSAKPGDRDRLAARFQAEYAALRVGTSSPDEIFHALQRLATGDRMATPAHQAASFAVLAFFFEECDIFERPE